MERTVFFRALEPEDAPCIYKWMNDPKMMEDAIGMKRAWSMIECKEWIEKRIKQGPYDFWLAICLNDGSNKMIGYTGINNVHYINSSATCNAIVIGEKKYRDGISWIETYLYVLDFIFNKLHLNRFYGNASITQDTTAIGHEIFFMKKEGIGRQEIYLNGHFTDVVHVSLLKDEYFNHLNNGDYELSSIIKRIRHIKKNK